MSPLAVHACAQRLIDVETLCRWRRAMIIPVNVGSAGRCPSHPRRSLSSPPFSVFRVFLSVRLSGAPVDGEGAKATPGLTEDRSTSMPAIAMKQNVERRHQR